MRQQSLDRTRRLSRLRSVLALASLSVVLAGCAGNNLPASVLGGECKIFERPPYVVLGKNTYDQDWIDGTVEAGVASCGWKRPQPRPAVKKPVRPSPVRPVSPRPVAVAPVPREKPASLSSPPWLAPRIESSPPPDAPVAEPEDELLTMPKPDTTQAVKRRGMCWHIIGC